MAFVDFGLGHGIATPVAARAEFTDVEWAVIQMARRDSLVSIGRATWIGRMLRFLFGIGAPNGLADTRLEALRRAAVRCWRGPVALRDDEVKEMTRAGFGIEHVVCLVEHVQVTRARTA